VPILGKTDEEKKLVDDAVAASKKALQAAGLRCSVDDRDWIRPGAKYFEWEKKGVPLRLEVGPRDIKNGVAQAKPRVGSDGGGGKVELLLEPSALASACVAQLDAIQDGLLAAAQARLAQGTRRISTYQELKDALARADAANTASGSGSGSDDVEGGGESGGSTWVFSSRRGSATRTTRKPSSKKPGPPCAATPWRGKKKPKAKNAFTAGNPPRTWPFSRELSNETQVPKTCI